MIQSRNILYQAKKKADNRSQLLPASSRRETDIKQELNELRKKNRTQQTQIIRLKQQVNDLREKVFFYQDQIKINDDSVQQSEKKRVKQMSGIPMLIENKQLKQEMAHTHQVNLSLNGKNREVEAVNRQLQSELKRAQTKLKQLEILQSIRSQQFKTQLQEPKPVIVQDNHAFQVLAEGVNKIIQFMRRQVIVVSEEIFMQSAKQCENDKKTSSYNIFLNYWNQLKKSQNFGYRALNQCLKSMQQLQKYSNCDKQQIFDINNPQYRDTLNQWIVNTLIQIKHLKNTSNKNREQKLFRLLGLHYRSKFPIQGEKYEMDEDVKKYFEEFICSEIFSMLII